MQENGILGRLRDPVAEGLQTLPNPELAEDVLQSVQLDAGELGLVNIYYQRAKVKRGKHSHRSWQVVRADKAK